MRVLALAGGLAGAVALSQYPEYSQQYVQRLSGAVDELGAVTFAFDTSAKVAGLTRDEALEQMQGSAFGDSFSGDMRSRINRYERLNSDYLALSGALPLERLARFYHISDPELARRTWDDFQPAVPVTPEGLIAAGIGFVTGWSVIAIGLGILFGRRRRDRHRSFVR